jgi:hypothetical protein
LRTKRKIFVQEYCRFRIRDGDRRLVKNNLLTSTKSKTSTKRFQSGKYLPNGRNCFSNRHDSERRLENPKKIKSEEIMKRFRLYFAIFIRQRDK